MRSSSSDSPEHNGRRSCRTQRGELTRAPARGSASLFASSDDTRHVLRSTADVSQHTPIPTAQEAPSAAHADPSPPPPVAPPPECFACSGSNAERHAACAASEAEPNRCQSDLPTPASDVTCQAGTVQASPRGGDADPKEAALSHGRTGKSERHAAASGLEGDAPVSHASVGPTLLTPLGSTLDGCGSDTLESPAMPSGAPRFAKAVAPPTHSPPSPTVSSTGPVAEVLLREATSTLSPSFSPSGRAPNASSTVTAVAGAASLLPQHRTSLLSAGPPRPQHDGLLSCCLPPYPPSMHAATARRNAMANNPTNSEALSIPQRHHAQHSPPLSASRGVPSASPSNNCLREGEATAPTRTSGTYRRGSLRPSQQFTRDASSLSCEDADTPHTTPGAGDASRAGTATAADAAVEKRRSSRAPFSLTRLASVDSLTEPTSVGVPVLLVAEKLLSLPERPMTCPASHNASPLRTAESISLLCHHVRRASGDCMGGTATVVNEGLPPCETSPRVASVVPPLFATTDNSNFPSSDSLSGSFAHYGSAPSLTAAPITDHVTRRCVDCSARHDAARRRGSCCCSCAAGEDAAGRRGDFVSAFADPTPNSVGGGSSIQGTVANPGVRTRSSRTSPLPAGSLATSVGNRSGSAFLQRGLLSLLSAHEEEDGALDAPITPQLFYSMREQQQLRATGSACHSAGQHHRRVSGGDERASQSSDGREVSSRFWTTASGSGDHVMVSSSPPQQHNGLRSSLTDPPGGREGGGSHGVQRESSFNPSASEEAGPGSSVAQLLSSQLLGLRSFGGTGTKLGESLVGGMVNSTAGMSLGSQHPASGSLASGSSTDLASGAAAVALARAPLHPAFPDVNGKGVYCREVHRRCLRGDVVEHTTVVEDHPYVRQLTDEKMNTFYCVLNQKYVVYQHELGRGSFSRVQLAYDAEDGAFYAVKILDKARLQRNGLSKEGAALQVRSEIHIMKQLRHRNIVTLREVFNNPSSRNAYLVMELAERGEVITMRGDGTIEPFDDGLPCFEEFTAVRVVKALLQAVMYAHHFGIAHRDIKPSNILLTTEGVVKLSDFGVSTFVDDSMVKVQREGSVAFLPPEMLVASEVEVAPRTPTCSSSLMTSVTGDETVGQHVTHAHATSGSRDHTCDRIAAATDLPHNDITLNSLNHCGGSSRASVREWPLGGAPPFTNNIMNTPASAFGGGICSRQNSGAFVNNATDAPTSRKIEGLLSVRSSFDPSHQRGARGASAGGGVGCHARAVSTDGPSSRSPADLYSEWLHGCYRQVDLFKADVFSIGVTTFAILMGRLPWSAKDAQSQLEAELNTPDPFLPFYQQAYGKDYRTARPQTESGWCAWRRQYLPSDSHPGACAAHGVRGAETSRRASAQQRNPMAPPRQETSEVSLEQPHSSASGSFVSASPRAFFSANGLHGPCSMTPSRASENSKHEASPTNGLSSPFTETCSRINDSVSAPQSGNQTASIASHANANVSVNIAALTPLGQSSANSFREVFNNRKRRQSVPMHALSQSQSAVASSFPPHDFLVATVEAPALGRSLTTFTPPHPSPQLRDAPQRYPPLQSQQSCESHEGTNEQEDSTESFALPGGSAAKPPSSPFASIAPHGCGDGQGVQAEDSDSGVASWAACSTGVLPWRLYHMDPDIGSASALSPRIATRTATGAGCTATVSTATIRETLGTLTADGSLERKEDKRGAAATLLKKGPPPSFPCALAPCDGVPHGKTDTASEAVGVVSPLPEEAGELFRTGSDGGEGEEEEDQLGRTLAVFDMGAVDRGIDADEATRTSSTRTSLRDSLSNSGNSVDLITQEIIRDKVIRPYRTAETLGLPGVPGERDYISPEAVDFVRCCLDADGAHRPSAFELFTHPWIQSLVRTIAHKRSCERTGEGASSGSRTSEFDENSEEGTRCKTECRDGDESEDTYSVSGSNDLMRTLRGDHHWRDGTDSDEAAAEAEDEDAFRAPDLPAFVPSMKANAQATRPRIGQADVLARSHPVYSSILEEDEEDERCGQCSTNTCNVKLSHSASEAGAAARDAAGLSALLVGAADEDAAEASRGGPLMASVGNVESNASSPNHITQGSAGNAKLTPQTAAAGSVMDSHSSSSLVGRSTFGGVSAATGAAAPAAMAPLLRSPGPFSSTFLESTMGAVSSVTHDDDGDARGEEALHASTGLRLLGSSPVVQRDAHEAAPSSFNAPQASHGGHGSSGDDEGDEREPPPQRETPIVMARPIARTGTNAVHDAFLSTLMSFNESANALAATGMAETALSDSGCGEERRHDAEGELPLPAAMCAAGAFTATAGGRSGMTGARDAGSELSETRMMSYSSVEVSSSMATTTMGVKRLEGSGNMERRSCLSTLRELAGSPRLLPGRKETETPLSVGGGSTTRHPQPVACAASVAAASALPPFEEKGHRGSPEERKPLSVTEICEERVVGWGEAARASPLHSRAGTDGLSSPLRHFLEDQLHLSDWRLPNTADHALGGVPIPSHPGEFSDTAGDSGDGGA